MNSFLRTLVALGGCVIGAIPLAADIAFVTDFNNTVYSFDTNDVNTPATAYSQPNYPDNIAFSPDGATVYFTTDFRNDVYSFPTNNPAGATSLNTGISEPMGIAISSDGALGFVAQDNGPGHGIYSFPTAGTNHTATLLTAITTVIRSPIFIAISGSNAFVGDFINGHVYSVVFTATTYDATLIQSFGGNNVGGLAISNDGFLYISNAFLNQIVRVPLNNPTATPTVVATPDTNTDGLAVSNDGKTVFFTYVFGVSSDDGIYSFPTDQGFPATATPLTNLNIPHAIDIAIRPLPLISPPTGLTGKQLKNDFGTVYERYNSLHWKASTSDNVAGYYVYRNGVKIATLGASELSYKDHDIKKYAVTVYSVTAFDSSGNESAPINIEIS